MPIADGHPDITEEQIAAVVAIITRASGRKGRCREVLFHERGHGDLYCPMPALPATGKCVGHSVADFDAGVLTISSVYPDGTA